MAISGAHGDRPSPEILAAQLDEVIPRAMAAHHVPGISLALFGSEGQAVARGYGEERAGSGRPVTPETLFEAASLTKPVIAAIFTGFAERGLLDPDRPLAAYLGPVPGGVYDLSEITPRMVLSHRTGLPNWVDKDKGPAPQRPAGVRFGYSGLGFMYLQVALETVAGAHLQALFESTVRPALPAVRSTLVWGRGTCLRARIDERGIACAGTPPSPGPADAGPGCATGHNAEGVPQPKRDWPSPNAAASLHTNPSEYARFMQLFLRPRDVPGLVSASGLRSMLVSTTTINGRVGWGLGWGLEHPAGAAGAAGAVVDEAPWLWHWGHNGPYKAFCLASPRLGAGIVVMTNGHWGLEVCREAVQACFPGEHPALDWLFAEFYGRR